VSFRIRTLVVVWTCARVFLFVCYFAVFFVLKSRIARDSRVSRVPRCSVVVSGCSIVDPAIDSCYSFLSRRKWDRRDAMSSFKDDKVPCARLCHIVKWDDFNGYGFNLHAQKGKNGQFIGKVDEGSPSLAAGLRQGDRIVEVNEIDIANETHNQVVERIKAFANETKLLVVDQEADDYFRENNIVIKGTMSNIKVIKTPERNPNSVEDRSEGSNCSVDEVSALPAFFFLSFLVIIDFIDVPNVRLSCIEFLNFL